MKTEKLSFIRFCTLTGVSLFTFLFLFFNQKISLINSFHSTQAYSSMLFIVLDIFFTIGGIFLGYQTKNISK